MTVKELEEIINKFVLSFLKEKGSDAIVNEWEQKENMVGLLKVLQNFDKDGIKTKKVKDSSKPKRGKTAYSFFCSVNREKAKTELGDDAKSTEIFSKLGEMWQELKSDSSMTAELEKYTHLALQDKLRIESELSVNDLVSESD